MECRSPQPLSCPSLFRPSAHPPEAGVAASRLVGYWRALLCFVSSVICFCGSRSFVSMEVGEQFCGLEWNIDPTAPHGNITATVVSTP